MLHAFSEWVNSVMLDLIPIVLAVMLVLVITAMTAGVCYEVRQMVIEARRNRKANRREDEVSDLEKLWTR